MFLRSCRNSHPSHPEGAAGGGFLPRSQAAQASGAAQRASHQAPDAGCATPLHFLHKNARKWKKKKKIKAELLRLHGKGPERTAPAPPTRAAIRAHRPHALGEAWPPPPGPGARGLLRGLRPRFAGGLPRHTALPRPARLLVLHDGALLACAARGPTLAQGRSPLPTRALQQDPPARAAARARPSTRTPAPLHAGAPPPPPPPRRRPRLPRAAPPSDVSAGAGRAARAARARRGGASRERSGVGSRCRCRRRAQVSAALPGGGRGGHRRRERLPRRPRLRQWLPVPPRRRGKVCGGGAGRVSGGSRRHPPSLGWERCEAAAEVGRCGQPGSAPPAAPAGRR